MSSREEFEIWGCSDRDLSITLKCETYAGIAWLAWQAATQAMEARCAALAAELKHSQIDAGCYKKGMEASNERLVQVAAENAALKTAIDATIGWQQSTDPENVESVRMLVDTKTPATDACLAEVRAQGVEMFAEQQRSFIGKPSKNDAASSYSSREAIKFADQLRKGAAS